MKHLPTVDLPLSHVQLQELLWTKYVTSFLTQFTLSVSSMRNIHFPLNFLAIKKLYRAVLNPPKCTLPVGLGAYLVLHLVLTNSVKDADRLDTDNMLTCMRKCELFRRDPVPNHLIIFQCDHITS